MQNKHLLLGAGIAVSLMASAGFWSATHVFAAPPASPYAPGETLAPSCAPGSPNCSVVPPAASGNNADITDLSGLTQDITLPQRLGIGIDPTEKLQIQGGNISLSSTVEQELRYLWQTTFPDPVNPGVAPDHANPVFKLGRVILGGVGSPVFRFLYADSVTPEKSVFEIEDTGTVASVRQPSSPGSHFEGFFAGDIQPLFRLNSFPSMQLEFGAGGPSGTDVIMRRVIDTLTSQPAFSFLTNGGEHFKITNNGIGANATNVDASIVNGGALAFHDNNELIFNVPNGGATLTAGDRSFVRLTSDCATAAACPLTLSPGTFGQLLILQWDHPTNTARLQDTGSVKLSSDWEPDEFDTLTLVDTYDNDTASHYWVEVARAAN